MTKVFNLIFIDKRWIRGSWATSNSFIRWPIISDKSWYIRSAGCFQPVTKILLTIVGGQQDIYFHDKNNSSLFTDNLFPSIIIFHVLPCWTPIRKSHLSLVKADRYSFPFQQESRSLAADRLKSTPKAVEICLSRSLQVKPGLVPPTSWYEREISKAWFAGIFPIVLIINCLVILLSRSSSFSVAIHKIGITSWLQIITKSRLVFEA